MKRQCNGNVDECFECGKYYASFSPHFEKEKKQIKRSNYNILLLRHKRNV